MGHSITTFHEQHIRARDHKVEVWLFLIVQKTLTLVEEEQWLAEACAHWEEQATLSINGCIDPDFDRFLTSPYKIKIVVSACKSIYSDLEQFGEQIPKCYLNRLCRYNPPANIKQDVKAEIYLDYGRALLALLDGRQSEEIIHA